MDNDTLAHHRGGTAPYTGWGRDDWAALADRLLAGIRPYAGPGNALIVLPGPEGGYGRAVDGLEGFARSLLLAGFRLAGEGGADPSGLAAWYAEGIATGTDPASPNRWVRLDEHPQAKVEAASLALVLDMTRPWIWDRLPPPVQEQVVTYLTPAVGDPTYPRINWVWFRLVVQTFLRSVGGPWSADDVAEDLASHDSFVRADGWLSDGPERSFDHYVGWALHLFPALWARMQGADDLAAGRQDADRARLDRFLLDAVRLVGADGSPLVQGRSLVYRFAAAAPFWVGALAEVPSVAPGLLRRAASGVVKHFADRGVPDQDELLTLGWYSSWPALAQSYSGPGSPYWAAKGMLGLSLPASHPVWTATELPLPVEEQDSVTAITAPGWLVSASRADGIVRVVNHATDHAVEGAASGDSPLYARLVYSTCTAPLLDADAWSSPLDSAAVLLDAHGRGSHRAGMTCLATTTVDDGRVGLAASTGPVRWLDAAPAGRDHGGGLTGRTVEAGRLTCVSLASPPWEVHLVHVDAATDVPGPGPRLRCGGWPVSGTDAGTGADSAAWATADAAAGAVAAAGGLVSVLALTAVATDIDVDAEEAAEIDVRTDRDASTDQVVHEVVLRAGASPLGPFTAVPTATVAARTGRWYAAATSMTRGSPTDPPRTSVTTGPGGPVVHVGWPDGRTTRQRLHDVIARDGAPPYPGTNGSVRSPFLEGES